MAIDRTGISSLDTGASDITYSGNEGPKSPDQQLMASADPMLVDEYNKYIFQMEEQVLQPISFREFVQQIMSESRQGGAYGGRIGFEKGSVGEPGSHSWWLMQMNKLKKEAKGMAYGGRIGFEKGSVSEPGSHSWW